MNMVVFRIYSIISQGFSFQKIPKNLDFFPKMDLGFFIVLQEKKKKLLNSRITQDWFTCLAGL